VNRKLAATFLVAGLMLQDGPAFAKEAASLIDLSVAADGRCQARIGDLTLTVTREELDARLPTLLPNKKATLRFGVNYEEVPDRCFGPMLSSLQRLGYTSIAFATEQPPLGPDVTKPGQ